FHVTGVQTCALPILVGKDALAVEQQAADQRAFAIIHRPCGNEAQQAAFVLNGGRGVLGGEYGAHQKYPSLLRFSIDASDVWSSKIGRASCREREGDQ